MRDGSKKGAFTFVLHSHLPYCRLAGRWPHGEEWIHEAIAETYVPLLNALYDLRAEGVKYKLTIGITPVLTEQLADALVLEHFEEYVRDKIERAEDDIKRFSAEGVTAARKAAEAKALAAAEEENRQARSELVRSVETQAKAAPSATREEAVGLAGAVRVATEVAQATAQTVRRTARSLAQVVLVTLKERFNINVPINLNGGAKPSPQTSAADAAVSQKPASQSLTAPATDETLDQADPRYNVAIFYRDWYGKVLYTFTQRYERNVVRAFKVLQDEGYIEIITCAATHAYLPLVGRDSTIAGQLRIGIASYQKHYGRAPRGIWLPECAYRPAFFEEDEHGQRHYKPGIEEFLAEVNLKVFFSETHTIEGGVPVGKAAGEVIGPYSYIKRRYVMPSAEGLPETHKDTFQAYWVARPQQVAVIGRNNRTSQQVWSGTFGYPGEADYREFHKKDDVSGLQYWRVTGPKVDLGFKDYYNPEWIQYRVQEHSDHFVGLVEEQVADYNQRNHKPGLIAANYDTELFGHWWFEGVDWIKEVLRKLAASTVVELTTASDWVEQTPPEEVLALPESSWGQQGTHFTWLNEDTEWMWPIIHQAERQIEKLVARWGSEDNENLHLVMQQITRELVLLESSDWPFLVTTGQARDYAVERFNSHVARFNELANALDRISNPSQLEASVVDKAKEYAYLDNVFPEIDYTVFAERERPAEITAVG